MLWCGISVFFYSRQGREGGRKFAVTARQQEFYDSHDMHIPVKSDKFVSIVVGLN